MGADQNIDWATVDAGAVASVLDWWRDAGVDVLVEDAPFDWLGPEAPVAAPLARREDAAVPATARTVALPATLAEFLAWRTGPEAPEAAWHGAVIAAAGPLTADLMVLVDCPERDDADVLMGGAVGRLFDRMLAAIGRSRADIHLAAVCAKRPTAGRMPAAQSERLSEIARHHVALVAPKRLLILGNAASGAILTTELAQARGGLRDVNHPGGKMCHAVASYHPRFLIERPAQKAEAWKDLQMLIGGMSQ